MIHRLAVSRRSVVVAALLVVAGEASPAAAQTETPRPRSVVQREQWPLETLHLKSGRVYRGLVESRSDARVDFVEVLRSPGEPMALIIRRRINPAQVKSLERLDDARRDLLRRRIHGFYHRARIEALRMEDLKLRAEGEGASRVWHYENREQGRTWFTVRSTMDEETTRRAIIRVEQIFAAYRRMLPPRRMPQRRLEIALFGSMSGYRELLKSLDLELDNPAFYSVPRNLIAAGSQLTGFIDALAEARRKDAAVLAEYRELVAALPEEIRRLGAELRQQQVPPNVRQTILVARRGRVEEALARVELRVKANERRNLTQFDELTRGMFTRLYHEAFHAYLENFVYHHRRHDVPRWLNEGLAQVFEQGRIEADTLRLDKPDAATLARLQEDLRGRRPLSLERLLTADQEEFLVAHGRLDVASERHYLYAWGLVYYLTFEKPLLTHEALDRYVSGPDNKLPPVRRFESLVGMSLPQFEQQWRRAMLSAK